MTILMFMTAVISMSVVAVTAIVCILIFVARSNM